MKILFLAELKHSFKNFTFLFLSILCHFTCFPQDCFNDELLPKRPLYTGIASRLEESLSWTQSDGVYTDFHGIWIHAGWKNNFGPCAASSPWTTPTNFRTVIDAGKIPVVYYWWHVDNPQSISLRVEAEQQLHDCLIPLLNQINRPTKEVWVVLQPEYNMNNVHLDPTFATHLIKMIDDLKTNVTGVKIKVGPSPGNFGSVEDRYRLHPSLQGVMAKSDFIAFHDIQRSSPTTDAIWTYPVPGQTNACLSFCRFLHNEYQKPIFFGYWSVANSFYSQTLQKDALNEIFKHQAEFERYGVFGFGPFWYRSESSYATEGLKSTSNTAFQVWSDYKTIVNNIAAKTSYIHSISFLDLDYGANINLPITLRWISRGKTGPITHSIYYQVNGGTPNLIANGLTGNADEIMRFKWEPCNFPTTPILNFILVADDGTQCKSPKLSYNSSQSSSNATYNFESGSISSFIPITSGLTLGVSSTAAAGTKSLQVNLANNGVGWNYLKLNGPVSYAGPNTIEMMIYVPYSLNNTMEMGSEVTYCNFYMQTTGTWSNFNSPNFGLNQGWNKVTWNYTLGGSDPKQLNLLEIRLWNRMGAYGETAKILIDDLKIGGNVTYSTPTNTCTTLATQLPHCSQALPISLISFMGEWLDQKSIKLDWSTSYEINNDYFTIERSFDGGKTNQVIGKINAEGALFNYFFIDSLNYYQTVQYRLKQVDLNGSASYTTWITLTTPANKNFTLFPNPASETITLKSLLEAPKEYTITIHNLLGESFYENSGNHETVTHLSKTIDIKNLPPAIYVLTFTTENGSAFERFVKE